MQSAADSVAPRTDKRKVRHDKKRQKLLDEAMALVVADGIEGLTIARLANRIGGSVGALYRYFESKEELVFGLQEMAILDFRSYLEARVEEHRAAPGTPARVALLAKLMVVLTAYIDHAEVSREMHRLVDHFLSTPEAVLSDDDARAITERVVGPILELVAGIVRQAVSEGALAAGDAAQRTHIAWACMHGLDHFRKRDRINPLPLQLKALLPMAVKSLLSGWGASAADLDAAQVLAFR